MRYTHFYRWCLFIALLLMPLVVCGQAETRGTLTSYSYVDGKKQSATFEYFLGNARYKEVQSFDDEPPLNESDIVRLIKPHPTDHVAIARYETYVTVGSDIDFGMAVMDINGNPRIVNPSGTKFHPDRTPGYEYYRNPHPWACTSLPLLGGRRESGRDSYFKNQGKHINDWWYENNTGDRNFHYSDEKDADTPAWENKNRYFIYNLHLTEKDSIDCNGAFYLHMYFPITIIIDEKGNWVEADAMVIVKVIFGECDDAEDTHVVIDDIAPGSDGEWPWQIPASVVIGLIGYTLTRGGGKGKGKDKEKEEQQPEGRCELRIYKEFGNTLLAGEDAQPVYARIVRIPPKGKEYTDMTLTAMIRITSGDNYMNVNRTGLAGEWQSANIMAPQPKEGEDVPEEGIVKFYLGNEGGSFTNKLHFFISAGEIRFKQDNLTLPARYEKTVRLPFIVVGMNDGTAIIKATITDDKNQETKDYHIDTEWNEKDQCYYAVIKDLVTDPKKDEGIAGNYLSYSINLEVTKNTSSRVIKGCLPLYRYYMGLVMRMKGNVNCFLEEYDPMRHDPAYKKEMPDGKLYAPAQQDCFLKLYDWDEETNKLLVIDPKPKSVKWTVKDIADQGGKQKVMNDIIGRESTQMGLDVALAGSGLGSIGTLVSQAHSQTFKDYNLPQQRLIEYQKQLDDLGLSFKAHWLSAGEGKLYYVLRCLKGVLMAPNRFDAEMEVTAEHKGKSYSFKRTVHILSQPKREFDSVDASMAAIKEDNKIRENLWEIEGGIQAASMTKQLMPLLCFIRLQLDFYHEDYGFDARNIKSIQDVYLHALQRKADEDKVKSDEATAIDNLKWYQLDWWLQRSFEGHDYLERMPLALRIGFAVASLGFTEIVFEVPYEMKKYIDEGGESVVGGFVVGATVAVKAYLIEAAVTLGLGAVGIGLKGVWKGFGATGGKLTKEAMMEGLKVLKETLKSEAGTGLKVWLKKQISWELGAAEKAIAAKTKALLESVKKMAQGSKYAAAEEFAKRQAIENVEHLQTMIELCHWNPTPENFRLRNQLILRCQADKQTMMLLKTPRLLGGDPLLQGLSLKPLKKEFNGLLRNIYDATDRRVIKHIAEEANISADQILKTGATSSSAQKLVEGLDVTFDRDITYYYIKNGKPHYFSQAYTDRLYAKYFRESVNTSTLPPNALGFDRTKLTPEALKKLEEMEAKQAEIAAKLYDQTVVEDILGHPESYGVDLERMIKKEYWGDALKDPRKVAEAVFHKGTSRFDYADALWAQSQAAEGYVQREILQARAVSEMMEGCRQLKKVFDLIKARDAARNTFSKIPAELNEAIDLLRPLDGVQATLSQVEAALAQKGYTFRSLAQEVSNAVYKVA